MRKLLSVMLFVLTMASVGAQVVNQPNGTARRIIKAASLPATCTIGDVYFKTAATVGSYQCLTTNNWTVMGAGGGGGAPTDATYITQTANGDLSAEQALGALSTGCLGSATTTGVVSARTITGTANQISVANGDCTGNPTLSIPTSPTLPGTTTGTFSGALTGNASTATALAANPTNCSAGNFPLGVDASGASENCTALPTTITGTANQITASASTGAITLSIPSSPTLPGTTSGTFSGNLTGNVTGNTSGTAATITGSLALANTPLTTRGDLLVANSTPALARLAIGAANTVLHGSATDPSYSAIVAGDITSATITGTQIASSIALAGSPTTTTQAIDDNSTKISTTAYVDRMKARALAFSIGDPTNPNALTTSSVSQTLTVPFACTISAYNLAFSPGDTGTITVKFWKVATGTAIPAIGNVINTSGVSIASGTAIHSTTVSDFTTTTVTANDMIAMVVTAVATTKSITGVLQCDQ